MIVWIHAIRERARERAREREKKTNKQTNTHNTHNSCIGALFMTCLHGGGILKEHHFIVMNDCSPCEDASRCSVPEHKAIHRKVFPAAELSI